jgi:hypothetical protein
MSRREFNIGKEAHRVCALCFSLETKATISKCEVSNIVNRGCLIDDWTITWALLPLHEENGEIIIPRREELVAKCSRGMANKSIHCQSSLNQSLQQHIDIRIMWERPYWTEQQSRRVPSCER